MFSEVAVDGQEQESQHPVIGRLEEWKVWQFRGWTY